MSLFCCTSIRPYRPRYLDHESKFTSFMSWAATATPELEEASLSSSPYAIQLVRQINFGPIETKRYFAHHDGSFVEITERDLSDANFRKLNAYKNFRCDMHNRFFEVNVYQKDPTNAHHWRADVARPAGDIDL